MPFNRPNIPGILLVEDDARLRFILAELLRHRGYLVETAANGTAALPLIERSIYDVLLTDYQLNDGVDGFDLLVKVSKLWPGKGKIIMSGRLDLGERCKSAGATYITKPFSVEDLLMKIELLLSNNQSSIGQQYTLLRLVTRIGAQRPKAQKPRQVCLDRLSAEKQAPTRFDNLRKRLRELRQIYFNPRSTSRNSPRY